MSVESSDGSNRRKVGMIGVLSNTESLYKPGAFGGATIEDPWECMARFVTTNYAHSQTECNDATYLTQLHR